MHLGGLLWSLLVILVMVVYFMVLFRVVIDVFRRSDLSGWGKAGWSVALLVVPLVSVLVYVIARRSIGDAARPGLKATGLSS